MMALPPRRRCRSPTRMPPRGKPSQPSAVIFDSRPRETMLRHLLIHPEISAILGRAGHHARVLIADGNYPASSKKGPNAEVVSLNLMPGVVTCTQVLQAVLSALPLEQA